MMVRIVPRLPDLDEPGRRRIVALLLQAARQDIRRPEIIKLETERDALGPLLPLNAAAVWTDLARAVFTFQEFLYVR